MKQKLRIARHSSANTLSSSSARRLSWDPNKVSDGAEESKPISFSRQEDVDKSRGETGASVSDSVNQITVFSRLLGLKLAQTYTCDCCSRLEEKSVIQTYTHKQRPPNASKFTVPSPSPDILGFRCGCRGAATPPPLKHTQSCTVKENEDKPGLWARGPSDLIFSDTRKCSRGPVERPKTNWAHQDAVRSGRSSGNPVCYQRGGADMGFATCFGETSFLRHRRRPKFRKVSSTTQNTWPGSLFSLFFFSFLSFFGSSLGN